MNDWEARARSAGLTYIQEFPEGYSRRRCGKGFKYIDSSGKLITCKETRQRLIDLVIPPAWRDVWICTDPDGHIQATGYDDAGRKQYIYHRKWHEASAAHKYGRLRMFATLLPTIRRHVQTDLRRPELDKRRVIAAVVRLLDKACIRIGNKQYLDANESRGATTLSPQHVCCNSNEIRLNFTGKSGKEINLKCYDEGLAAFLEDCERGDSEFLFSYQNGNEEFVAVTSNDVNGYLCEITKESVTTKDFRTWRASVIALHYLSAMEENLSKTAKKRFIVEAVKCTAEMLGNTPAVCRGSYIHSAILASADEGKLPSLMRKLDKVKPARSGLTKKELLLLAFLTDLEKQENKVVAVSRKKPAGRLAA